MTDESEWMKLPTEEKIVHKVWKARLNGYEEAKKIFDKLDNDKDPEFSKYLGTIKKIVSDSNAFAQEKGLDAVLSYVEKAGVAGKTCSEVVAAIILKCLNARQKTRDKAMEICLMYLEIEKHETTTEELIKGLSNKQPKVVASCIQILRDGLREFGNKVVSLKPVLKVLPTLFEHSDKMVREEAKLLVVEAYRWAAAPVKQSLQSIKPVQLKELEEEWEKLSGPVRPTRYLRSQQEVQVIEAANSSNEDTDQQSDNVNSAPADEEIDMFDLMDPVDILLKLPKNFYENIEGKKWQSRKEALDQLLNLATSNPKLASADYADLLRAVKKVISKDNNVMLVTEAAQCVTAIANGLRKKFSPYATACIQAIVERFKDKKPTLVQALRESADACFNATSISAITEEMLAALESKSPSVKTETALFLGRSFIKTAAPLLNKQTIKPFCIVLVKRLSDQQPDVRDAAAEAIASLWRIVGEKLLGPYTSELDKLKLEKVKEFYDKIEIEGKKPTPTEKSAPSQKTDTQPSARLSTAPAVNKPTQRKPLVGVKTGAKSGGQKKSKPQTAGPAPVATEFTEKGLALDEAAEVIEAAMSAELVKQLASSNWKERLAGCQDISEKLKSLEKPEIPTQAIMKVLAGKPPWKENNFQVMQLKFAIVSYLAQHSKFSRTSALVALPGLVDKTADMKSGPVAREALTNIADTLTFSFIAEQVVCLAFEQKNPKIHSESLNWLSGAILEFGFKGMNTKMIVERLKLALSATNPAVRQAAINLLSTVYLYLGPTLRSWFDSEKPALLQQIDAALSKVEGEKPPAPVRGLKNQPVRDSGVVVSGDAGNVDDTETDDVVDSVMDLIPRVDISDKLTTEFLTELTNTNWKVRAEALEKLSNILKEAKLISPNIGELIPALKQRLADNNKKLASNAVEICAVLATAIGPPVKQFSRALIPGIYNYLSDNKPAVRQVGVQCLNVWCEQVKLATLVDEELLVPALTTDNVYIRTELFGWLQEKLADTKTVHDVALTPCLPILYKALEDRNADVRKAAQAVLPMFMLHLSFEKMMKAVKKLSPASKTQIAALLGKQRDAVVQVKASRNTSNRPSTAPPASITPPTVEGGRVSPAISVSSNIPDTASDTASQSKQTDSTAPGSRRGSKNINTKAKPVTSKKQDEVDSSPPIQVNNSKEQRMKAEATLKTIKWNFVAPHDEVIEQLKEQANSSVSKSLHIQMFNTDFKQHLAALTVLAESVDSMKEASICQLDVLLRWVSLRFFDTNTTVLLKSLEFVHSLFTMLTSQNYSLSDYEATSFIPYLILKIGDAKDEVRRRVHTLFSLILKCYPASKVFSLLMDGVKTKNSRQRAECLDELGGLIKNYGINVCQPTASKALREIAAQFSVRDNNIRTAALNCVVEAFNLTGDQVYRYVGNLSDKDQSLLDERIKRTGKQPVKPPTTTTASSVKTPATPPTKQQQQQGIGGNATIDGGQDVRKPISATLQDKSSNDSVNKSVLSSKPSVPQVFSLNLEQLNMERFAGCDDITEPQLIEVDLDFLKDAIDLPERKSKVLPGPGVMPNNRDVSSAVDLVISQIGSNDIHNSIQAAAQVDSLLKDDSKCTALRGHVDQLLTVVSLQMRMLLNTHIEQSEGADVVQLLRSLCATLVSLFQRTVLGKSAGRDALKDLTQDLIVILLDKRIEELSEQQMLIKSLNILVVKVIDKADHTNMMTALIRLLHSCVTMDTSSLTFVQLVMKCLWKMIRNLNAMIENLNVDKVLYDIHLFLRDAPTSWWRNRPNDTPLRTVKTILHTLATLRGSEILNNLTLIEDRNASEVEDYVRKVSRMAANSRTVDVRRGTIEQKQGSQDTGRSVSTNTNQLQPVEYNEILASMFKRIGKKETTKQALEELYTFKQQHPYIDIQPFLDRSSVIFRSYILRGLKSIERDQGPEGDSVPATEETRNRLEQSQNTHSHRPATAVTPVPSELRVSDETNIMDTINQYKEKMAARKLQTHGSGSQVSRPSTAPVTTTIAAAKGMLSTSQAYSHPPAALSDDDPDNVKIQADLDDLKKRLQRVKKAASKYS